MALEQISGKVEIPPQKLAELRKTLKDASDFKEKIQSCLAGPATGLLEVILGGAACLGVSDIHIEPRAEDVRIRARIDGLLRDVLVFERKTYDVFLSRSKLISGTKLNVSDQPQDGRFTVSTGEGEIEIRVSILPTEYGESVVFRILNPKGLVGLEGLGLRNDLLKFIQAEIRKPNGMLIITGPTGAGKTTTLYALLKEIKRPEIKIITIEDPIEYHLEGISQTQVAPEKGYDFASGLLSVMRQDPNVILVGEIRDLETCEVALQAALTGHLVLTTLHTNDAAGTISRLINLGAKPSNIGPAVNAVVAQRLVRRVCPKCFQTKTISDRDYNRIKKALKGIPENVEIKGVGLIGQLKPDVKLAQAKGCKYCNQIGYRGRVGIFEAFAADDEVEAFVLKNQSIAELKKLIIEKGMLTLYQDGLLKVLEGITTIEEVERVIGEYAQ